MPLALHLTSTPLYAFAADPAQIPAWRLLLREADRLAPELNTLWRTLFADVRANVDQAALRAALARRNLMEVEALLSQLWEQHAAIPGRALLAPLLRATVQRAAEAVTPHLLAAVEVTLGNVPLSLTIPASLPWIDTYAGVQIQGIGERTVQAIRGVLREGFSEGTSAGRLAAQVQEIVGLTPRQARSIAAYRGRLLDAGRSAAVVRREVAAVVQVGIRQRALNIARTESLYAANAGQEALWAQATNQGLLDPAHWQQSWLPAQGEQVCPICGGMRGQRRDLGQPFTTPGGALVLFPPAHPSCRCTLVLVLRGSEP